MNNTSYSTTSSHKNYSVLFFAWTTMWSCVEKPEREDSGAADSASESDGGDSDSGPSRDTGFQLLDIGLPPGDPNQQIPPPDVDGCHGIYAQDNLPTWSHPVVAGGRLYLRDQDTIYAFDVKQK